MIRLYYPTTTDSILLLQESGGILQPDLSFCLPDDYKERETVVGKIEVPVSEYPHFSMKWHLMRAYEKAEKDGSYPALLSCWLQREELTPDVGFILYSHEAKKRIRKHMNTLSISTVSELSAIRPEVLITDVLGQISWRTSLKLGNSVASEPVNWDLVVFAAVITNRDWLKEFCTTGQYKQDWDRRHEDRGVLSAGDVARQLRYRGGVKAFSFLYWYERIIQELKVESTGTWMRVMDLDGKRLSEYPGMSLDDILRFKVRPGDIASKSDMDSSINNKGEYE